MLEAEAKAEEAMKNITMTSIVRLANQSLDKVMEFDPKAAASSSSRKQKADASSSQSSGIP